MWGRRMKWPLLYGSIGGALILLLKMISDVGARFPSLGTSSSVSERGNCNDTSTRSGKGRRCLPASCRSATFLRHCARESRPTGMSGGGARRGPDCRGQSTSVGAPHEMSFSNSCSHFRTGSPATARGLRHCAGHPSSYAPPFGQAASLYFAYVRSGQRAAVRCPFSPGCTETNEPNREQHRAPR